MEVFKDRLKQCFKLIMSEVVAPFIVLGLIVAFLVFISQYPVIVTICIYTIAFGLGLVVLLSCIMFINWLFIEPFRKKKNNEL